MVHFADDIPSLPNENSEDIPRINTISLTSEENFISLTVMNVARPDRLNRIAPIYFKTERPESIVIEENQVVFEEPSVSCQEIKLEKGAIRIETNESETRETRNKEAEEDYKEDEKPLRAQRSKISEKILSLIC